MRALQEIKRKYEERSKPVVDPIYLASFQSFIPVKVLANDDSERNWDDPWVIQSSESGQLWIGDPHNQKILASWGGVYKKDKVALESGRSQQSVDDAVAKERADAFFEKHVPPEMVDLMPIEGGAGFAKAQRWGKIKRLDDDWRLASPRSVLHVSVCVRELMGSFLLGSKFESEVRS